EGSLGGDLLVGDNDHPLDGSTIIGNDVLIGDSNGDRFIAEAGADIMMGGEGADRHEGGEGFDWAAYMDDNLGVTVDMNLKAFDQTPLPPSNITILDRFDEVEGLSGSNFADILRGDDVDADDIGTRHALTN